MATATPIKTATSDNPAHTPPYADRHTTEPDAAAAVPQGLEDLPPDLALVDVADAKALSKMLFARLDALEEGTPEHAYVRNSLVELNLALVRYAVGRMGVRSESYDDVVQIGTIGRRSAIWAWVRSS